MSDSFIVGYIGKNHISDRTVELFRAVIDSFSLKTFNIAKNELQEIFEDKKFSILLVDYPYNSAVIDYLDGCSKTVKNTLCCDLIINKGETLYGYNTIASSFTSFLEYYDVKLENKKILLLGHNPTSVSIKYALNKKANNDVYIADRNFDLGCDITYKEANKKDYNIVINTSYINPKTFNDNRLVFVSNFKNLEYVIETSESSYRSIYLFDAKEKNKGCLNGFWLTAERVKLTCSLFFNSIIPSKAWFWFAFNILISKINVALLGVDTKYKRKISENIEKKIGPVLVDFKKAIQETLKKAKLLRLLTNYPFVETEFVKQIKLFGGYFFITTNSTIENYDLLKFLSKSTCFVYLKTTKFEDIYSKNKKKLVISKEEQKETYNRYNKLYEKYADITVNNEESVAVIINNIKTFLMGGK